MTQEERERPTLPDLQLSLETRRVRRAALAATIAAIVYVLAVLAAAAYVASCKPPSPVQATAGGSPEGERASVVIMRQFIDWEENEPSLERSPWCGGVAVGPDTIVTVAHCIGKPGPVEFVTRGQWYTTARAVTTGDVLSVDPVRDIAIVRSRSKLARWVSWAEPISYVSAVRVVRFQPSIVGVDGPIYSPGGSRYDSGAGVFTHEGALIGLVATCYTREDGTCAGTGGRLVRP